jgi:putative aldouronate transport system permease protein
MVGVIIAFKDYNFAKGIFGSDWIGLSNFTYLFTTNDAFIITRNTLLYNLTFIVLNVIVPVTLAILFNELRGRFLPRAYQTIILLPYFLSMIIVSYLVFAMLSRSMGFMNTSVLPFFGIEPVDWYNERKYWPFILTFVHVWKNAGYTAVIYLAALSSVDPVYYEAIAIDGGGKLKQIRYISIPFLKNIIIVLSILAIGRIFNSDFGLFYQVPLQSGTLFPVTNVIDTYVYRALTRTNDIAMASAAGFYKSVVGFVLVLFTNWVVSKVSPENTLI